jgi:hypothetical protein
MKDIEAMKERFLQEDVSVRLGELAVNLSRTKSRCQNDANRDVVKSLIRDSMYLIEWTAPEMDIDTAAQLVDKARALSRWKLNWESIWFDTTQRTQVARLCRILVTEILLR